MLRNLTPAQATVIAALISAAVAVVIGILNNRSQRKRFADEIRKRDTERDIERAKADAVRDARLEMWMTQVDKKLDTHNGYAERFAEIGEDIAVIKNDIKTLYKAKE